jgi:pSer/pThr/pTyr-binding forkhead associated (FHA) protein
MALKVIGRTGRVAGHDMVVAASMKIGAAADNDFRIGLAGVSRHHARIVKEGDAYWLEDAGSTNGTFLNGQRVSARERLSHLDVITLGRDVDLITVATDGATSAVAPTKAIEDAWLEPLEAQAGGPRVDIPLGEVTLGRVAPSNVLLDSPLVSQLHARIERTADHLVVSDLGSVNGTFVNGRSIKEPVELADGDALVIAGSRHFRVHIAGNADRRGQAQEVVSAQTALFDSGWKTRLVWSADELAELEAERKRILASVRKEPAQVSAAPAVAKPAPVEAKPAAPAAKPPAPKPPAPPPVVAKPAPPKAVDVPAPPAEAKPPTPAPVEAKTPAPAPVAPAAPVVTKPAPPPVSAPSSAAPPKPAPPPVAAPPPAAPPKPAPVAAAPRPAPITAPKPPLPSPDPNAVTVLSTPGIRGVRLSGPKGTFQLDPGRHVVGRAEGVGVSILDPQVSRAHAAVSVTPLEVRVEDTGSANGTMVNGVKVASGGVALKSGDTLAFGKVEFTVELLS